MLTKDAKKPESLTGIALPVSVVIPAYNRADLVARAVRSAACQVPNPPDEIIVVDDCSSDMTGAVAQAAGATVIRHEQNRGEGAARNTAIEAARHAWVALLDSDDEWLPDHLARLWSRRHAHVALAASAVAVGGRRTGTVLGHPSRSPSVITDARDLVFPANPLPASGVMARRDALLAEGGFRQLPTAADLDMWVRLLAHGSILACPEVGYRYYLHAGQVSSDGQRMRDDLIARTEEYERERLLDAGTVQSVRVAATWDEFRQTLSSGDYAGAWRDLSWICSDRHRQAALWALLRWRYALRRRARTAAAAAL